MKKIKTRVLAAAGAVGAVVIGLSSLGAGGAAAGALPGGSITKNLADGTPVSVKLFDEYASYQRAVTNVQTSREVWVSGKVKVSVGGKATGGTVKAGYLVGCQVDFGADAGAAAGFKNQGTWSDLGDSGLQYPRFNKNNGEADPAPGGSGTVTLKPGGVSTVWVINTTSGSDTSYSNYNVNSYSFTGNTGGVAYSQEKFGVDGCAGYAQAKAIVQVTVDTDSVKGVITLYGKPFSLG
ncbi:MspA family porin [Gordonia aichiensis]|uniref:Porin MspA n=1 Tax=Gordonia aichiensis NBRC 108223 TaxID=1220583 RepID=L7KJZ6_9ACTN|nr:MspA family porin [Gordonia aichiensis]GAC48924.1 hypothetical protein GOACH_07_02100 [Gordonia aichiensis NBRC 108223]